MSSNLFAVIPADLPGELTQALLTSAHVRIERIVSHGHASPAGFWYDQPEHEWILLVQGAAQLRIADHAGAEQIIDLRRGDYLHLPAHQRHRIEWTTSDEPTIWLAVFYGGKNA